VKEEDVPQFTGSAYGGHKKLLYAVDAQGNYKGVASRGCEIESAATFGALDDLRCQVVEAWEAARRGECAPLRYHMYRRRMDPVLLAQTAGLFRWRVERHLRDPRFARLPRRILRRYAEALGLEIDVLTRLPDAPER
jgi:hypothetical protein